MEIWQLCADHLKTVRRKMSSCMWLAGICRKPGNLSSTLQHALHPISALRVPGAGLSHLLGSYGVCPDIPCLSCLHLSPQLLVQQSTQSRATGRIRTSIAWSRLSCSNESPLVFISFSFSLVFRENLQSFVSSGSNNQGFRYMPGASLKSVISTSDVKTCLG